MSNIKTRESVKDIKVLDKAAVASERMKTALVRSKDQVENLMDDGQVSPSEYAEDNTHYVAACGRSCMVRLNGNLLRVKKRVQQSKPCPFLF